MGGCWLKKSLIISGPVHDLADLLAIARVEGRKALKADKVRVLPYVAVYQDHDYLVVVENDGGGKVPVVGNGKNHDR